MTLEGLPTALTVEEGASLLAIARSAAAAAAAGRPAPDPGPLPDRLLVPHGAFVTLKSGGDLRGCIGVIEAREPLAFAVRRCAAAAATRDPRFAAIAPEELPGLVVEVSVLGPTREVRDSREIVVGRDGLIVSSGRRQGLLLPQVAVEHGWDRVKFLEHTCVKAGLDPDAWKHGARVEAFSAQVIEERADAR